MAQALKENGICWMSLYRSHFLFRNGIYKPLHERNGSFHCKKPRGAQIEALYALADSRKEGAAKGLVQAATGVGKTYLAAESVVPFNSGCQCASGNVG